MFESGDTIFSIKEKFPTYYHFELQQTGKYTLSFKDSNNFDIYLIHIESIPITQTLSVPKDYRVMIPEYEVFQATVINPQIIGFSRYDDRGYVV